MTVRLGTLKLIQQYEQWMDHAVKSFWVRYLILPFIIDLYFVKLFIFCSNVHFPESCNFENIHIDIVFTLSGQRDFNQLLNIPSRGWMNPKKDVMAQKITHPHTNHTWRCLTSLSPNFDWTQILKDINVFSKEPQVCEEVFVSIDETYLFLEKPQTGEVCPSNEGIL